MTSLKRRNNFTKPKLKHRSTTAKKVNGKALLNEEISSDSDVSDVDIDGEDDSADDNDLETPQEKRIRIAKDYIDEIKRKESSRLDDQEAVHSAISTRLLHEQLDKQGVLQRPISQSLEVGHSIKFFKNGHKLAVTCVCLSRCGELLFTSSKDSSVIKWSVHPAIHRLATVSGGVRGVRSNRGKVHCSHVLSMSLSSDDKYLATGDIDGLVFVWSTATMSKVHLFRGHRGPISALAFRRNSHQLFSGSHDKTIRHWKIGNSPSEVGFLEALFGHTHHVTGLDSFNSERCISSGGSDRSVRLWKIVEESQLVFQLSDPCTASVECVSMITEQYIISGQQDNSLCIWSVHKKKPLCTLRPAHNSTIDSIMWITSVCAMKNTDVVASGAHDGFVRLWKVSPSFNQLSPLNSIAAPGFVNSLCFNIDGTSLAVALGQEHKLGRWWKDKSSKNQSMIVPIISQPLFT